MTDGIDLVDIVMPEAGVAVEEGTVVAIHVEVGARVDADDPIVDISTDKIDTEVPSPAAGVITELLVRLGETIPVGGPIARLDPSDTAGSTDPPTFAAPASPPRAEDEALVPALVQADGVDAAPHSPVVARMAAVHAIDLARVKGTGRDGRVRKQDLLDHIERHGDGPATEVAAAVTLSPMRCAIAANMRRSIEEAAHVTTWIEVDMTAIEDTRRGLRLTALPIICSCLTRALRDDHRELNAWIEGDTYTIHDEVNLGVAVSLGVEGLIVPVVHGADTLSAGELGARIGELAGRARAKELTAADVAGGTFTVTNAGRHGTLMSSPIINRPQVAILDVQAISRQPAVVVDVDGHERITARWMTVVGLSWDHRALDGDLAAEFLGSLKRRLETWRPA